MQRFPCFVEKRLKAICCFSKSILVTIIMSLDRLTANHWTSLQQQTGRKTSQSSKKGSQGVTGRPSPVWRSLILRSSSSLWTQRQWRIRGGREAGRVQKWECIAVKVHRYHFPDHFGQGRWASTCWCDQWFYKQVEEKNTQARCVTSLPAPDASCSAHGSVSV